MYSVDLEIKNTTANDASVSDLNLLLSVGKDGQLRKYDQRLLLRLYTIYYTIPFGFSLFWNVSGISSTFENTFLLRTTDEGSVPEIRIWSIL